MADILGTICITKGCVLKKMLYLILLVPCFVYGKPYYGMSETQCISLAVYHEARGEPDKGKVAVVNVILNRMKNRKATACQVVFAKHQFSFTANLKYQEKHTKQYVLFVRKVVDKIKEGRYNSSKATHFHLKGMKKKPKWAKKLKVVATIGNHIFYSKES